MNSTNTNSTSSPIQTQQICYCEPSFFQAPSECNPAGCKAINSLILVGFVVALLCCLYRFKQMYGRKDSRWPYFTLSLLSLACSIRVARAILTLTENSNFLLMGFLFVVPLGLLICCFFSTLFVWVKIVYHINFSKIVTKIFPFLGYVFIGLQVILMALLFVVVFANLKYDATNILLCLFLGIGVIFAVIFTNMIWIEYRDISNKDCGVFNERNHQKIKKIFKLSITAIIVTLLTLGLTIWSFIVKGVLTIPHAMAFNFIGRFIEILWVSVMLIILQPQLQTWSQNSARTNSGNTDFDDDEDDDSSSSSSKGDIEKDSKDSKSDPKKELSESTEQSPSIAPSPITTTAAVTTSPIINSPVNNPNIN